MRLEMPKRRLLAWAEYRRKVFFRPRGLEQAQNPTLTPCSIVTFVDTAEFSILNRRMYGVPPKKWRLA